MKYIGTAYYPEVWPQERLEKDVLMMKEAGINIVRLAEFAWSVMETSEGVYEFAWLHEIADLLAKHEIKVMFCTPSAAMPPWMARKYPEILLENAESKIMYSDERRRYCPSSEKYREMVSKIVTVMASEFADQKNLVAWQIDNEIAIAENPPCVCKSCLGKFRLWLKDKYSSLDALNNAWGTRFWSAVISDWEEIKAPFWRNSARLDWQRFQSSLFGSFTSDQAEILRKANPSWTITTNSWINPDFNLNLEDIFRNLDIMSYDCYINMHGNIQTYRAAWDMYRSMKQKPFWIAETGAWNYISTHKKSAEALNAWAWEFFARGAEALIYFRWHQSLMGEEDHPAILPWSGEESDAYRIIKKLSADFKDLENELQYLPLPDSEAAILFDPQISFLHNSKKSPQYKNAIITANEALNRLALCPEMLFPEHDRNWNKYKLILAPQLERVSPALAEKIRNYLLDGGTLVCIGRLALTDENGKYIMESAPCGLSELLGFKINERIDINSTPRYKEVGYMGKENNTPNDVDGELDGIAIKCFGYMEKVESAVNVEIRGRFKSGLYEGAPLCVSGKIGKGKFLYIGTVPDNESLAELMYRFSLESGLLPSAVLPRCLSIIKRGDLRFYINSSENDLETPLIKSGRLIRGKESGGLIHMGAFESAIVKES